MEGICKLLSIVSREEGLDFQMQHLLSKRALEAVGIRITECLLKWNPRTRSDLLNQNLKGYGPQISIFNKSTRH